MIASVEIIRNTAHAWEWSYYIWTALHYIIGLSAVGLASLAASKALPEGWQPRVSIAAAVSVAVLTFLRPAEVAFGFDQASSRVNLALVQYDYDVDAAQKQPSASQMSAFGALFDAYATARENVSAVQPYKTGAAKPAASKDTGAVPPPATAPSQQKETQ